MNKYVRDDKILSFSLFLSKYVTKIVSVLSRAKRQKFPANEYHDLSSGANAIP
jgi:hypothetical protein